MLLLKQCPHACTSLINKDWILFACYQCALERLGKVYGVRNRVCRRPSCCPAEEPLPRAMRLFQAKQSQKEVILDRGSNVSGTRIIHMETEESLWVGWGRPGGS